MSLYRRFHFAHFLKNVEVSLYRDNSIFLDFVHFLGFFSSLVFYTVLLTILLCTVLSLYI